MSSVSVKHKSQRLLILLCSNLKSKIKGPIYSVELWQINKYNEKMIQIWSLHFVKDWSKTYHSDLNFLVQ